MKILGIVFLIAGFLFAVDAAREQMVGEVSVSGASRTGRTYEATREEDPEAFQGLMTYQWVRAFLVFGVGYIFFAVARRMDRSDLFSPDHDAGSGVDEWEEQLRRRGGNETGPPEDKR